MPHESPQFKEFKLPFGAFTPYLDLRFTTQTILFPIHWVINDTDAATAAKYGVFFTVPFPCTVIEVRESHAVKGSDVNVTLDIEKLTSGQAEGAGNSVLTSTIDLTATANTPQRTLATETIADRNLDIGDRLAVKTSGTLTAVNNVTITVLLKVFFARLPKY